LVTDLTLQEIAALKKEVADGVLHPMDAKMRLAQEVIAGFHGDAAARKAAENFQRVFRDRQAPVEAPITRIPAGNYKLLSLLTQNNLVPSRTEAERLIRANAVEMDGSVFNQLTSLFFHSGEEHLLRVGKKKFLRIVVE
jgi:tyrosyl-tRNA synthetase